MKRLGGDWRRMAVMGWVLLFVALPAQASEPGWMGVQIQEVGRSEAQAQNLPRFDHAQVTRTVDGAPAGPAGIRAGDVIVSINGETVSMRQFQEKVASYSSGDTISVEISRGGLRGDIDVTLTSHAAWQQAQAQTRQQQTDRSDANIQWRDATFFISMDIVKIPCSDCSMDPSPLGLSFGGTVYFDDVLAVSGAIGIGIMESEVNDVDIGLDPYIRANLKVGHFSNPDFTVYGLVGFEPYTLTFDGTSANDSVGDIALGFGGSLGNARRAGGGDDIGVEFSFVQDSDLDDSIVRASVFFNF